MYLVKKKNIYNKRNKKIAVHIPIITFCQIEDILENYDLVQLIEENQESVKLALNEATSYHFSLDK